MNVAVRTVLGVDGELVVLGAFCPTCQLESLPHDRHGTCLFCDTVIYRALAERDIEGGDASIPSASRPTRYRRCEPPPGGVGSAASRSASARMGPPQFDRQSLMDTLNDVAADLGRTPFKREWERFGFSPSARTYIRRFGSWSAACTAAGLDAA